jgi:carboxylesterase type B
MVFIHGGYFMFGGTDLYRPNYFMDEDVVLVTINYRLGAFGFLSTGDDVVPGNMGLKDQVLALKWVQAAIKEFGGDPNLVTVFGESAGGGSVHFHMFSHLSAGLFHRGISQSGSSFCPWANVNKDVKTQSRKLGELLNCPSGSSEALVKCLRAVDGSAIAEIHKTQFVMEHFYSADIVFTPTLEKGKDTSKAFLTTSTRQLSKEGKLTNKVPWLAGVNSEEGCWKTSPIFNSDESLENFSANWKALAPKSFIYYDNPGAAEKIRKQYFGQTSKKFTSDDYSKATQIFSDRYFLTCHGEATRAHSKHAPTYSYYFSHTNPEGNGLGLAMGAAKGKYPVILELLVAKIKYMVYTKVLGWEVRDYGVCHADELMYLFYTIPTTGIWKGSPHYEFSKSLLKLWVNFAENGYPGKYNGIEWEEVIPDKLPRSMHLGEPAGMIDEPFTARAKFWEDLKLTPK